MAERKRAVKQRRRERKNVPRARPYPGDFNNTIVTITDSDGT
jgi:ribosomal protein S11